MPRALPPRVWSPEPVDPKPASSPSLELPRPSRRMVLRGVGGAVLGLPWLETFASKDAKAGSKDGHYAVFIREGNGVVQAEGDEDEAFWPRSTGAITPQSLSSQKDRALSELAAYADRLLVVKGIDFGFESNGCGHSGGGNQVLTAARVSSDPSGADSLAMGESIDNYIARHFPNHNGGEPLTLYTGPRNGYLEEVLSYRGPLDLRAAEDDPWTAYMRMVGGEQVDEHLNDRRRSVNDLVKSQMDGLMRRSDLSTRDRQRLELHFDSIRDVEQLMCRLSEDEEQQMASLLGLGTLNDNRLTVARMQCDLIALAFACDFVRVATLQVGDGNDQTEYTINGQRLPSFHYISHRQYSDGDDGTAMPEAYEWHKALDREFLKLYAHLLDRLDSYGILDQSVAVQTNDLATGPGHVFWDVPYIIAGRGNGLLKQGQFVDVGGQTNNRLFNTIATAVGLTGDGDGPVENFGDPSLTPGMLSELLA